MAHAPAYPNPLGRPQPGPLQNDKRLAGGLPRGATWLDLDGSRIAANAGAVALNAVVLLLLLAPMAVPPPSPPGEHAPDVIWLRPKVEPKPIVVPVVQQPRVQKQTHAAQPRIVPPQTETPVVDSRQDDIVVPPTDPVVRMDPADTIGPPLQPAASARLQTVSSPPPPYPIEAIRQGLAGTVELEILVDIDGKPLEARVVRSSGHRLLDQAARKVVLSQWRFRPAVRDGQAVQALGRVPIVFTLAR